MCHRNLQFLWKMLDKYQSNLLEKFQKYMAKMAMTSHLFRNSLSQLNTLQITYLGNHTPPITYRLGLVNQDRGDFYKASQLLSVYKLK